MTEIGRIWKNLLSVTNCLCENRPVIALFLSLSWFTHFVIATKKVRLNLICFNTLNRSHFSIKIIICFVIVFSPVFYFSVTSIWNIPNVFPGQVYNCISEDLPSPILPSSFLKINQKLIYFFFLAIVQQWLSGQACWICMRDVPVSNLTLIIVWICLGWSLSHIYHAL